MIKCTNPERQIKFIESDLTSITQQLKELEEIFGKHDEINAACKAVNKVKRVFKSWERVDIHPGSGISIQEEIRRESHV